MRWEYFITNVNESETATQELTSIAETFGFKGWEFVTRLPAVAGAEKYSRWMFKRPIPETVTIDGAKVVIR